MSLDLDKHNVKKIVERKVAEIAVGYSEEKVELTPGKTQKSVRATKKMVSFPRGEYIAVEAAVEIAQIKKKIVVTKRKESDGFLIRYASLCTRK